jgi:lysine 6-dehydrogenase
MAQILVLGCGMVGSLMAADMASDRALSVTVADSRPTALARAQDRATKLGRKVCAMHVDLAKPGVIGKLVANFDLVLGSMASGIAFAALKEIILAGKKYADISFMSENALELDALAKQHGATCVVDCGVAPGMSHILAANAAMNLDVCKRIEIYVGGLPMVRTWPFEYKAGFAPADVIEEYTRPTRMIEHGKLVIKDALTEPELLNLPGVGTLEAVNTDGLRSLVFTHPHIPFMVEKTLRYPGHYELMRVLAHLGLMSTTPIDVGETNGLGQHKIVPRDVLAKLMFPHWSYQPGERDLTVMRVIAKGTRAGKDATITWDLLDHEDAQTGSSMSRTTAFPCTSAARMLLDGTIKGPGVIVPEMLGQNGQVFERLLTDQSARGVKYTQGRM